MSEIGRDADTKDTIRGGVKDSEASEWGFRWYALAGLVIAFAAVLRFLFIGKYEIWLDETYCFAVARKSISVILADLAYDNGPPLYYIALHYWMRVFGESTAAIRSLSAVFGTATVAVVVRWNAPWFSRRARLLAGLALAITPLAVHYSQETRMYAPLAFFVLVSMVFLERGLRVGGIRNWALYVVFTACSIYTSYAAFFVLPVGYAVIATAAVSGRPLRTLLPQAAALVCAHMAAGMLFIPWWHTFANQPKAAAVAWVRGMWELDAYKLLKPIQAIGVMTTGGCHYPLYLTSLRLDSSRIDGMRKSIAEGKEGRQFVKLLVRVPSWLTILGCLATAGGLLVVSLRGPTEHARWRGFLVSWMLLSFMLPYAASFVRPMYVLGRYDLTGSIAFAILSGIALDRMSRGWRAAAIAVMSILFLYTYGFTQAWPGSGSYEPKAKAFQGVLAKGDVVIATTFEYGQAYYHVVAPIEDDVTWLTFPRETVKHFAWIDYDRWLQPGWTAARRELRVEADQTIAEALNAMKPGSKLIIVWPPNPPSWAAAMNSVLEQTLGPFMQDGFLLFDGNASVQDQGIMVLRKP
jgi:4-amino-4-deoxy-L-arabinose transferase-like glycosyltransferase